MLNSFFCLFKQQILLIALIYLFTTKSLRTQRITKLLSPDDFVNSADVFFISVPLLDRARGAVFQITLLHLYTLTPSTNLLTTDYSNSHRLISFSKLHPYTVATSFYVVTLSARSIHFKIT